MISNRFGLFSFQWIDWSTNEKLVIEGENENGPKVDEVTISYLVV